MQQQNRQQIEAVRAQVLKRPSLPASKNPLLGRWIQVEPKSQGAPDVVLDPDAAFCSMIFGGDAFEYRADALVLDVDGEDIAVDRVTYRAGKGGSVFAVGEKNIRLLVFEFDAGPDRMRDGKGVYAKVTRRSAAKAPPASVAMPTGVTWVTGSTAWPSTSTRTEPAPSSSR